MIPTIFTILLFPLFLVASVTNNITKYNNDTEGGSRVGRFINFFSAVRFSNNACVGAGGLNGTCYTEQECSERNGAPTSSCAGGFGVCCIFGLSCGGRSSENNTYISTELDSNQCIYTICRMNPNVVLLRLDFDEFNIAQPFTCGGSSSSVACTTADGPKIGDCIYDSMTITTPGSPAPPIICGYNTGQHMWVESSEFCNKIVFNLGLEASDIAARTWMIKVTQYDSTQESSFVPPIGCLQYIYGYNIGRVSSFNFKDQNSYHLSNQRYSICWRRERSKCSICFSAGTFGLSNVPSAVLPSPSSTSTSPWTKLGGYTDSICCNKDTPVANCGTSGASDYIEFQGAQPPPAGSIYTVSKGNRWCGRWMALPTNDPAPTPTITYSAVNSGTTLCTQLSPFRLRVMFDDGEVLSSDSSKVCGTSSSAARTADTSDECATFRLYGSRKGTIGFQFVWWHNDC